MSLSDRVNSTKHGSVVRFCAAAAMAVALLGSSACTVRPLYGSNTMAGEQPLRGEITSISIKPVTTRYAQEVRNHLIFLFNGGRGQPADARYSLQLNVARLTESSVLIQSARENEPTAGTLTLVADYTLIENGKGRVIAAGTRRTTASYDISKQEFAAMRAIRDAENRASRELAQILQLAIAKEMTQQQ